MTDRESWRRDVPVDPTGIDEPHDILAADEFGIGTRDERLPPDPSRFDPPHDILAAEEFAMPAGGEQHEDEDSGPDPRTLVPLVLIAALLAFLLVRRRR
jgi:MYXO-CTERM domain-containing protein